MDDNDNAGNLIHLGALRFFASRLAPTVVLWRVQSPSKDNMMNVANSTK
jgi:hypothetical protein